MMENVVFCLMDIRQNGTWDFSADMRRFDISIPGICMKLGSKSDGIGFGTQQKAKKSEHLYKLCINSLPGEGI